MKIATAQSLRCPACQRPVLDTGTELLDNGMPHASPERPCRPVPAEPTPIELDLGSGYGLARGSLRTDWETGESYYSLTGTRLSGTWTVSIAAAADVSSITTVTVCHGEDHEHTRSDYHRANKPVVNGIEIVGATTGLDITAIASIGPYRITCLRADGSHEDAPDKTRRYTAAVVRGLLTHFTARTDLATLHRVTAVRHAQRMRGYALDRADAIEDELADLTTRMTADRDRCRSEAARYDAIASGTRSPGPAPHDAAPDD
ncbi:hypothetical protein [Nocardia brasiliensis]|uniref:hypothetical protein n=1 Tax=Nocardia brasiliensis TaxID=37326 RepID=UPI0024589DB8|nr:hypothetical protein [Nocardia brasiliensis]